MLTPEELGSITCAMYGLGAICARFRRKEILILTRVQLSIKHHAQTLQKKKGHPFDALSEPVLALIINEYVDKSMRKEGMSRYAVYSSVYDSVYFLC